MAFLILNRGADTARDRLTETFWPGADPDRARDSLITALSSIRGCLRALGAEAEQFLQARKSVVRWTADTLVDAERFAEIANRADASATRIAVRLYRGDFLEGDYDDWAVGERERLSTIYETLLARAIKTTRDPEAARRLIGRNPYAEEAYVMLIETELEAGRNSSAAALAAGFRKALSEVSEKPSEAFEERFGHVRLRSLETPPSNLPRQTTSFVGREADLAKVQALLTKSRLVTIVGAGGVGKTRVAVHAGAQVLHGFGDGVWFADLATISGEGAVVTEIASALNIKSSGFSGLLEHVVAHLKHKQLLLVLDNCEHVVSQAALVVDSIIAACPRVTVLATSRESLELQGEQVYPLPPLAVPQAGDKPRAEEALNFGAVALFVARASAVDARFTFGEDAVGAVVQICHRLDGVALAIELAAARVTSLNVHQLLERMREQFRVLTSRKHAVHPRHQTMRAALDWSYEWLSDEEQALFRRLGIFRGGWTLESIHAAGADESHDEFAVLDRLWPLVSKSLVAVEFRGQSQRYRLMEPLRQYALELLKEHGELEATARYHARYFAEFARQVGSKWLQVSDLVFVASIEEEIDNIRAALEWALVQRNDPVLGAQMAAYLGGFWFTQYYHEGLRWLETAQAAVTYETHPRVSLAIVAHMVRAHAQTDTAKAIRLAEEWLGSARALGEEQPLLRLILIYGLILISADRLDEAEAALNEALELAERIDRFRMQYVLFGLARLNRKRGNINLARELSIRMAEAHEQSQLPGDRNRWFILSERASAELLDGRLNRALELCREAHRGTQLTKDVLGGLQIEYYLGVLLLRSGAVDEARMHGHAVLKISTEELLPHGIAPALQLLAGVATQYERHELAARLLGFAEKRLSVESRRDLLVDVDPEWFLQPLRDHFGEDALAKLLAEGAEWSQNQALDEALKT